MRYAIAFAVLTGGMLELAGSLAFPGSRVILRAGAVASASLALAHLLRRPRLPGIAWARSGTGSGRHRD